LRFGGTLRIDGAVVNMLTPTGVTSPWEPMGSESWALVDGIAW
jgi:hypothetical protein